MDHLFGNRIGVERLCVPLRYLKPHIEGGREIGEARRRWGNERASIPA